MSYRDFCLISAKDLYYLQIMVLGHFLNQSKSQNYNQGSHPGDDNFHQIQEEYSIGLYFYLISSYYNILFELI
jgi:dimeric dUTPase (all-alpha-NTP-PPase superfamily)